MDINKLYTGIMEAYIKDNIEEYESFEEYSKTNYNVSIEEFEQYQKSGFIKEITCGTYNGSTNKFVPWEINLDNLIKTILQDIKDCDYYEVLEDYADIDRPLGYVNAYTEMYNVFTIGNKVFVDLD